MLPSISTVQCNSSSNSIGYSVIVALTGIGYSVIVALTGLPIGYSVIVALTGLPIGYSVIVALTGLPIGYSVIVALTGLPIGYSVIVALTCLPIGYSVTAASLQYSAQTFPIVKVVTQTTAGKEGANSILKTLCLRQNSYNICLRYENKHTIVCA